jgi:glycosyltransferase involved in cell wall biosynthesis
LKKTPKILLIGPLPSGNQVGGAVISFSYLRDYFQAQNLPHHTLNTQPYAQDKRRYLHPIILFLNTLKHLPTTDIVFVNMSRGGTKYIAPFLFLLTKLFGRKFVFRPFGSRTKEEYEKYGRLQKWLFERTLLQSDLLLLQTKLLCQYFQPMSKHIRQLPTSRDRAATNLVKNNPTYSKRFVFLGHLKTSKGIDYLLEARTRLGDSYTLHFYGPIEDEKYQYLESKSNLYQGVLRPNEVLSTLSQYDVLILPTFYIGEGYPGAIIEAYSIGMPVIATRWKSIPEILEDGKTGILIAPRSTDELVDAITAFNDQNYSRFAQQAKAAFEATYNASVVMEKMLKEIYSIA